MTEQKLSLDEMIELAKVFNDKGKWTFLDGYLCADRMGELSMYMSGEEFVGRKINYSIQLSTYGRNSGDVILVESYFVDENGSDEHKKISELYDLIKKSVYASQVEKQRQRDAEASFRHVLIEQRKQEAIDAARKLIGK
jgi:hypothetical protein